MLYKPEVWLFPGQEDNTHISVRSIQNIFNKACKEAGIIKNATTHWLRHYVESNIMESEYRFSSVHAVFLLNHSP